MEFDSFPVHVLDLTPGQFKTFMDSFDHIISDCDGVIWTSKALPHVADFFNLMKSIGKTVHYVSTISLRSQEEYEQKFEEAGIDNGYENMSIPSRAIAEYLVECHFDKAAYCVTCPETINILESYGITCKGGPHIASDYYEEYLLYLEEDPEIGAVIFDWDLTGNLAKINKALTYLKRNDVMFICGSTDRQIYFEKEFAALGSSIFTDIVAVESGRVPVVMSKPSRDFGEYVMTRAGVTNSSRVLYIGDTIEQDVTFGKANSFKTLMVLTNLSKKTMMDHQTIRPEYYLETLGSLVPKLRDFLNHYSSNQ